MKVLITGGAGFIGANLAKRLVNLNHEVVILDDFSSGSPESISDIPVTVIRGSITDFEVLSKSAHGASAIVHLAARGSVPRSISEPRRTFEVNATGTFNVAEVAREQGQYLIFSSSSSVYGSNPTLPKSEFDWTRPISPYGASKLAAESTVLAHAETFELNALVLRFFNVFGPGQLPDHPYAAVIPRWLWSLRHGRQVDVFGDGLQTRDFTYIDAVVDTLVSALDRKLSVEHPVNLGFGTPVTLLELLREVEEVTGSHVVPNFRDARVGDVRDSMNNPVVFRRYFPEVTQIALKDSLERTRRFLADYSP